MPGAAGADGTDDDVDGEVGELWLPGLTQAVRAATVVATDKIRTKTCVFVTASYPA